MELSKSIEDYLETIYLLKKEKGHAKVNDIASNLNISPPSVTEIIRKLAIKNLVKYEKYGPVELTLNGEKIAKKVYNRHKILIKFLLSLGIDKKTAFKDACLAEHVLSEKTIRKLKAFVKDRRCK